jgi:two-component system, cell cycle response regulator DivK
LPESTPVTSPPLDANAPLVLIVDDSDRNRKLARDVLRAAAFRTLEAASALEAIALATEQLPDVILMDLRLPDMDGAVAARMLAAGERTRSIPIVAVSSLPVERSGEWFVAAGFAGCLEKPISVRAFPDQVRRYCRGASTPASGERAW